MRPLLRDEGLLGLAAALAAAFGFGIFIGHLL